MSIGTGVCVQYAHTYMVGGGGEMAQVTKKQPPPLNHQYNRRAQMKIMVRHSSFTPGPWLIP